MCINQDQSVITVMILNERLKLIEERARELESMPIDEVLNFVRCPGDSMKFIGDRDTIDYYCKELDANYILTRSSGNKTKCQVYIGSFALKR